MSAYYATQGGYDLNPYYSNDAGVHQVEYESGQATEEAAVLEEGVWGPQLSCLMDDANSSVVSMEYDESYERLWVGHANGRVMSLQFDPGVSGRMEATTYCSFLSGRSAVVGLHPVNDYIVSTMASQIRMHSNGGLAIASVNAPQVIEGGGISVAADFSCSGLCHPGGVDGPATHLIAGTKRSIAVAYDLSTFASPVLTMDLGAPAVCMRENRYYNVAACENGSVKLIDGRLRSSKLLHSIDAHTGPCMDAWLSPNDSMMYTCGKIARPLNPYDANSPVKHSYDQLVKVFDLRTNRQLPPLRDYVTGSCPYFIRFVPSPSSRGGYGAQVMLASGTGQVQVSDPNGDGSDAQILYAQLSSQRDSVTSVAVASSGQLLATGSYSGVISQFSLGLPAGEDALGQKVNNNSSELVMPPQQPRPPMVSLGVNAQVLASSYVLRQPPEDPEPLASSFATSAELRTARFKLTSKRVVSKELLQKMNSSDFIGTVSNPGFAPNSLLYAGPVDNVRAYALSDPRNVETTELGLTPAKSKPQRDAVQVTVERPNILPAQYRKQHSFRGKARMNKFNYSVHNSTEVMALENVAPNSYTNTILQLLFSMPEIRAIALASQASTYHHQNPHTMWCELGFLFHMMLSVQKEFDAKKDDELERIVTPANFQRTFQCIPEAVALGLFDGSHADSQAHVQTFTRFILQQMHREAELESRAQSDGMGRRKFGSSFSAVDDIFGFTVVSTTKFLISNKIEVGVPNRSFALDLAYPSTKGARRGVVSQPSSPELDLKNLSDAQVKPASQPASFAAAMWGSLRKETSMRGWCKSSESYEPFKQVRSMLNLPRVLTMLCGETQKDPQSSTISGALGEVQSQGSMHACYWSSVNVVGGAWLPIKLEVAMLRVGAESASQTRLIVSGLLVPGPDSPRGTAETWVIFDGVNDCVAPQPASQIQSYGIIIKAPTPAPPVNINKPYNPNPQPIVPEAKADEWEIVTLNLVGVVSQVQSELGSIGPDAAQEHAVLHIKRDSHGSASPEWVLCNDFSIQYTNASDTVSFQAWRHPCSVFFSRADYTFGVTSMDTSALGGTLSTAVPASILALPSQSSVPCIRLGPTALPGKGELVAFDAEFVTVQLEQAETNAEGQRVIVSEARQNIARVSFVRGGKRDLQDDTAPPPMEVMSDDYVIPSETILDYLTRFSGIVAEDLQPGVSKNAVVHNRTAYLKLRMFADRGCIFVGHGLNTDFETANIFVPKDQILDTVEFWRLPGQRKLSLRFLAAYFLKEDIQDEVHDSIEDAKIALLLYRHYQRVEKQGHLHLQGVLQELYSYGAKTNWTIV